jgi:hypothetical protein
MKISRALAVLGVAAVIGGCASTPTGPSVMVLPGPGKAMDQFQADDTRCRQIATGELQRERPGTVPAQQRYDMTYMQCMYAAGNQIPGTSRPGYSTPRAAAPATSPGTSQPPGPPAGTPPPPPSGPAR